MSWKKVELGEVVTLQRGYDLTEKERRTGKVPVVSSSGISGYHDEAKVKSPGVVTGRYGTLGQVYYVTDDFWPHNTTLFVKDFHGNDVRFVYYLLSSLNLGNQSAVSAVPGVNRNTLHRLPVLLPPLPIQRRIAEIMGRLDDKIEVNRRINRTLEAMAQALYQHWFVDFGPFQAGEFVESELGLIPKGWEVAKLGSAVDFNPVSVTKGEKFNDITYIDISSVSPGHIDNFTTMSFANAPSRARRRVAHGDTIWSGVRPGRRAFCLILHPADNLLVSTGFIVIRPLTVPYSFIYSLAATQEFTDYLVLRESGAAYPAVKADDFALYDICLPPYEVLNKYHSLVEPWLEQRHILQEESHKLGEIRDYLLPKLLSGEIPIEAATEQVDDVTESQPQQLALTNI